MNKTEKKEEKNLEIYKLRQVNTRPDSVSRPDSVHSDFGAL